MVFYFLDMLFGDVLESGNYIKEKVKVKKRK